MEYTISRLAAKNTKGNEIFKITVDERYGEYVCTKYVGDSNVPYNVMSSCDIGLTLAVGLQTTHATCRTEQAVSQKEVPDNIRRL